MANTFPELLLQYTLYINRKSDEKYPLLCRGDGKYPLLCRRDGNLLLAPNKIMIVNSVVHTTSQ